MARSPGSEPPAPGSGVGVGATQVLPAPPPEGMVKSMAPRPAEISQINPAATANTTTPARISTFLVTLGVDSASSSWGWGALGAATLRWAR